MRRRFYLYLPLFGIAGLCAYLLAAHALQPAIETLTPQESAGLAYYVEAQRVDPIFAIEGTDPAKLRTAIQNLFEERDKIAQLYPRAERTTIISSLYPNEFLHLLPDLEEARQTMLREPSVANAKKYHTLVLEATSAYASGARSLASTLISVSGTIKTLGYIGGTSNTDDVAATLMQAATGALAQHKKEQDRFACLKDTAAHCPSIASLRLARAKALATPPLLNKTLNTHVRNVDALSQQLLSQRASFKHASKKILAIPSTCFVDSVAYMRPYYSERIAGALARKHTLLNTMYFYDVPEQRAQQPDKPLYQALTEANVAVEYQNVGNLYMCPDAGLDVTHIGSIIGVLDLLGEKQNLTPEEQALFSLPVVQKADIAEYIRTQVEKNTPSSDSLAERYLEGSADFDQVIMGAHSDNHFLVTWDKMQHPVQYEYMLLARNFASTLLLMGNPTFVPQRISLFSSNTPSDLERMYLREYSTDVSKHYTDAALLEQNRASVEIGANSGPYIR